MKMVYRGVVCGLNVSEWFSCTGTMPEGYGRIAVVYALTRFFRRNREVREKLVWISREMRFAKGRKRGTRRLTLIVPASAMELPCGTAKIRLAVDAFGVELRRFMLLDAGSKRTDAFVWEEDALLPPATRRDR